MNAIYECLLTKRFSVYSDRKVVILKKTLEVVTMKITDKKKPVKTIPAGVWESSRPNQNKKKTVSSSSTDMQGNGYPVNKQDK